MRDLGTPIAMVIIECIAYLPQVLLLGVVLILVFGAIGVALLFNIAKSTTPFANQIVQSFLFLTPLHIVTSLPLTLV
jgi:hypothetical protein